LVVILFMHSVRSYLTVQRAGSTVRRQFHGSAVVPDRRRGDTMTKCGVSVAAAAALVLSAAPSFAADGWVVRICRGFTDAASIKISAGAKGKEESVVNWRSDNKQLDYPVKSDLKQLHVMADSEPADGRVSMCVLHGAKAVKAMNFNDMLDVTADQTAGDDKGCKCPKSGGQ
jgi:hypothetical protein